MNSLLKDFAFGARTLRKNPGFAITALLTLALGIGASTAIFSVVDAVLLRPLPYANADRLYFLTSDLATRKVFDFPVAPGDLKDLRDQATQLDEIAGVFTGTQSIVGDDGQPEQVHGGAATPNLFRLLGVHVVAGRDFNEDDATPQPAPQPGAVPAAPGVAPAAPPLPINAVISYSYWQRRYGGALSAVGRTVDLGGARAHIVGVLGPEFELLFPPRISMERVPDIMTALRINFDNASRINVFLRLVARTRPGATRAAAQQQVNAITADLRKRFPIKETAGLNYRLEPMHEVLVADVKPAVLALMGAVTFVLLIACTNVANLILVRTSRRERELAVRAALGGSRLRLVRQMLAEALLLATGGAILGALLAKIGINLLVTMAPRSLPRVNDIGLDPVVLGFTAIAALLAAAVFGIVPALRASRPNVIGVLRSGGRNADLGSGTVLRNVVAISEVALAFVLLIGGGLMMRSFMVLSQAKPGFDAEGLLTLNAPGNRPGTPDAAAAFSNAIRQRLSAIPGVAGVTAVNPLPFNQDGNQQNGRWGTESAVNDPSAFRQADVLTVLPGYFDVMRIHLVDGRVFTDADNLPTSTGIIIDQLLAAKAYPGQSAVGKRIFIRFRGNEPEWLDIIGVVAHQRTVSPAADGREEVFIPNGMVGFRNANHWILRTSGDPMRLASAAKKVINEIDPLVAVADVKPMTAYVDLARAPTRFALTLIGAFSGIAVVLALVGLYGVLSTLVRQRTAEIGVRMALGAPSGDIFRLMIGQGLKLSSAGIVVGLASAFALTRVMRTMLIGVEPTDPVTFVAISVVFLAIAAAACWLPARKAARLDPLLALRGD